MRSGQLVILGMFALAIGLGAYVVWYQYHREARILAAWGNEAAWRIRNAERVELLLLKPLENDRVGDSPAEATAETATATTADAAAEATAEATSAAASPSSGPAEERLRLPEGSWSVVQRRDLSGAPGLIHVRHVLIQDAYYEWDQPPRDCEGQWQFALRFEATTGEETVAFDSGCLRVLRVGGSQPLVTGRMMKALLEFLHSQRPPIEGLPQPPAN